MLVAMCGICTMLALGVPRIGSDVGGHRYDVGTDVWEYFCGHVGWSLCVAGLGTDIVRPATDVVTDIRQCQPHRYRHR